MVTEQKEWVAAKNLPEKLPEKLPVKTPAVGFWEQSNHCKAPHVDDLAPDGMYAPLHLLSPGGLARAAPFVVILLKGHGSQEM